MIMCKRVIVLISLLMGLAFPCSAWRGFDRGVGDYVEVYASPGQVRVNDIVEVFDCTYGREVFMGVIKVYVSGGRYNLVCYDQENGEYRYFVMN